MASFRPALKPMPRPGDWNYLPPELRNKIWLMALPPSRMVGFASYDEDARTEYAVKNCEGAGDFSTMRAKAMTDVPIILQVNRESRSLGLGFFKLSFAEGLNGRPIYFDFEHDILFIKRGWVLPIFYGVLQKCTCMEHLHPEEMFLLKMMWIGRNRCKCAQVDHAPTIRALENVREIIFQGCMSRHEYDTLFKMPCMDLEAVTYQTPWEAGQSSRDRFENGFCRERGDKMKISFR